MGILSGVDSISFMKRTLHILLSFIFPEKSARTGGISSTFNDLTLGFLPKARPTPLPDMTGLYSYKHPAVRSLIWQIKYRRNPDAIHRGARALHTYICTLPTPPPIILIPMPSSRRRIHERGYNQCILLVDAIAAVQDEKSEIKFKIQKDILLRRKHTDRQTIKNKKDRELNMRGVFVATRKPDFLEKKILIIDDVITTGATMHEAQQALKKAGYLHVYGISLAH